MYSVQRMACRHAGRLQAQDAEPTRRDGDLKGQTCDEGQTLTRWMATSRPVTLLRSRLSKRLSWIMRRSLRIACNLHHQTDVRHMDRCQPDSA